MALGIDAAAHEGALAAGSSVLPTVAVIGTGVDRVYPRAHKQLAHRLAQQGLVISEFPLGTPPIASDFPNATASFQASRVARWWSRRHWPQDR